MTSQHISVFEHECVRAGKGIKQLTPEQLSALQEYYGSEGVPYFNLIHNGIRFCEYVGVIQVGSTVIEVLPKADKSTDNAENKSKWREMLISMMRAVGFFEVHAPSSSYLNLKSNSILDLYFELFLKEVEYLLHIGLVKKYHRIEGNATALKGSIKFGKHIQKNIVHQERFYIRFSTFDTEHKLHFILYKAILLLKLINVNHVFQSRIGALLLNFPEMPDIQITEATFESISYNRKTEQYKKAIEIARLILLKYHPDISTGRNNVLALMFSMNDLWEQFVYVCLKQGIRKNHRGFSIRAQAPVNFWKPVSGCRTRLIPDIEIKTEKGRTLVLDTKWKNLGNSNPSPEDLRQMFAYHEYCLAEKVSLVYPGEKEHIRKGTFFIPGEKALTEKECSVISIPVGKSIKEWKDNIYNVFKSWAGE